MGAGLIAVRRYLFAAALIFLTATDAQAIPRGTPYTTLWPSSQTVNFGAKTRFGFGGSTTGYANQAALGVTRWLKITSQTGTVFGVDDRNMLVPCAALNGSGVCTSTYGNAWTPGAGPYTVVVSEYSDSGRTAATGNSTTITVNINAAQATIREMTSSARGCLVNCETVNPDAPSDTSQIATMINNSGYIALGDTIKARDGFFNPTSLSYRVLPLASYSGSGVITVQSETQDSGLDANGNLQLMNGFQIGGLTFNSFISGDVLIPVNFDHVWFYANVASPAVLFNANNSSGYGQGATYSRFEQGCATTSSALIVTLNGQNVFDHDHFVECLQSAGGTTGGSGIAEGGTAVTHPGLTVTNSVFENMWNDGIDTFAGPNTITDNFFFGWQYYGVNHPDTYQSLGVNDGTSVALGSFLRNISVRGVGITGAVDAQGLPYIRNDTGGALLNGMFSSGTIKNNINNLTEGNCILLNNTDNPDVEFNTCMMALGTTNASANQMQVTTPAALLNPGNSGGTGGTFARNIQNVFNISLQAGSPTNTFNLTVPVTAGSPASTYVPYFGNYVGGENSALHNRAAVISLFTPTLNGSAKNGDGSYSSALTPPDSVGAACWNDGRTNFNNAQTCAAQGLTVAQ